MSETKEEKVRIYEGKIGERSKEREILFREGLGLFIYLFFNYLFYNLGIKSNFVD